MSDLLVGRHLRWMQDRGLAETYIATRKRRLAQLAGWAGKPLAKLTEQDLCEWRSGLRTAPDSVRVQVAHIREFYKWLADNDYRRDNPARRIPVPKATRRLPRPISAANLRTALRAADADIRLMLALSAQAGLRACEIAGLRWESIDLAGGYLLVTAETAKGHRERVVLLCPWLIGEIRAFGCRPSGWVFRRLDGRCGPNRPWTISSRVGDHFASLGSRDRLHAGRHRYASELLDGCGNLRIVQEQLGHASPATTAVYTKVRQAAAAAAVAALPVPA